MLILGIETSCDETAAAVTRDGREVLSNVIASQVALHAKTGGVVPEVAAREHVGKVLPVIQEALRQAKVALEDLDAIAVANGPGLVSALLSGVVTANTLAKFSGKKLIPVNHVLAHIRANWLERDEKEIQYPVVALTASGGHNELVLLRSAKAKPQLLGETNDDAAGEAFDKVARLLGLGYPGGPEIERVARAPLCEKGGGGDFLPRSWLIPKDVAKNFTTVEVGKRLRDGRLKLRNFDFSFSGLKSEVRRRVQGQRLTKQFVTTLATEFQEAVVDVLATKTILAAKKFGAKEIHVAGGVSANKLLRSRLAEYAVELGITFRHPVKFVYCTDNAAMVAGAGYWVLQNSKNKFDKMINVDLDINF